MSAIGVGEMPSSAVRTFADPDAYASAIRATKAELTVTGRGQFAAKIIRTDLHRLMDAAVLRQSSAGWALGRHERTSNNLVPH
jgi:hypothetical protein